MFSQATISATQCNLLHKHSLGCHATVHGGGSLRDDPKNSCAAETRASVTKTKARLKVCEVLWFIVSLSILIGYLYFGEPVTRLK